jgi:subtilase family serine protease
MGRPPSRRRLLTIGLAVATTAATVTAMTPSAYAAPSRHQIAGSVPNWLGKATQLGDAPAANRIDFGVTLKMRDQGGAAALIDDLANPDSKNYGNWLSDAQFNARFAPAASDVSAVRNWLTSQGFQVVKTLPSGMYIEASGTTAQVAKTFGTPMKNYKFRGKTVRANASTLSLPVDAPASVVGTVSGVIGVDQGSLLKQPADTLPGPPPGARFGVQPCSAYYGQKIATDQPDGYGKKQPYTVCGYGPQQYQSAYGETDLLRAGITGKGVTVAITDAYAAPTMLADAQKYNQVHNQPLFRPGQYREITPAANCYRNEDLCDPQGWYGEESL